MSMVNEIKGLMKAYCIKYPALGVTVHRDSSSGLQIKTQPPIQSSIYGQQKFKHGLNTVWLSIYRQGEGEILLARLSETSKEEYEFEQYPAFDNYQELIAQKLDRLRAVSKT